MEYSLSEQLSTAGLQMMGAVSPIDESSPSIDEVGEAVTKLRGGKVAWY